MVQRRKGLGFAQEAREPLGVVRERLGQDLDRDVTIELGVARPIDFAMPPRPISWIRVKTPRRVPGARAKWLIIRAERPRGRDYSCLTG
jgi:hypothetical protein